MTYGAGCYAHRCTGGEDGTPLALEIRDPSGAWRQCTEPSQLLPVAGRYVGAIACPPEFNALRLCGNATSPLGNTTGPPLGDTTGPPLGDTTGPPLGDTTGPPLGDTTGPRLGDTTGPRLGDTTGPWLGGTTTTPFFMWRLGDTVTPPPPPPGGTANPDTTRMLGADTPLLQLGETAPLDCC